MNKKEIKVGELKELFTATPVQISNWKKEHGDNILRLVIFPAGEKSELKAKACYVRKPTLVEMILAEQTGNNSVLQEGEILLNNCWLAGDEEIKTNPDYTIQACYKAHGLIEKMISVLEKV